MRPHTISFRHALSGIYQAVTTQLNLRIHLLIATLVCLLAVWLRVDLVEGLVLLLAVSSVLVAELVNSALESLSDAVTLESNSYIKSAKDISAGAVLTAAFFAALTGLLIFVPKIMGAL